MSTAVKPLQVHELNAWKLSNARYDLKVKQDSMSDIIDYLDPAVMKKTIFTGRITKFTRIGLRLIAVLAMGGLFLWQAGVAIQKYQDKLTSLQERLADNGSLLYPSITFCPKYWQTQPGIIEMFYNNKSATFQDLRSAAWLNNWSRERLFGFMTHSNVVNRSYPCTTVGGSKSGKACSFPFKYQTVVDLLSDAAEGNETESKKETVFYDFDECSILDDVTPWCYTRTKDNFTYILGEWGYCDPACTGQKPDFESEFNVARYDNLWEIGLYDLSTWGSGLCHTYNPPKDVEPGESGKLYAFFGDKTKRKLPFRFLGYVIYLHDNGQFWPGLEMDRIGMSQQFFLPKDVEWEGYFIVTKKTLLNKDDNKCVEDPKYRFTDCVLNWVANTTGCHLDWYSPTPPNHKPCTKREELRRYNDNLFFTLQAKWLQLSNITGCFPKCSVRSFTVVEKNSETADSSWDRKWYSAFYLSVKTSSYAYQTEFYAYDVWDLTAGLGGLMGVFLGWSFVSVIVQLYMAVENFILGFLMRNQEVKQMES